MQQKLNQIIMAKWIKTIGLLIIGSTLILLAVVLFYIIWLMINSDENMYIKIAPNFQLIYAGVAIVVGFIMSRFSEKIAYFIKNKTK